jgi:quercetin dioxygenase-like cupin family protein
VAVRIFHCDEPGALMPMIASDARLVVWPGAGAERANMNYVRMQPGEANVPHVHEQSEDTIFVLDGRGTIADLDNGRDLEFEAGEVIHVPVGVEHQVRGDRGAEIVSVGGPAPADFSLLRAAGVWSPEG